MSTTRQGIFWLVANRTNDVALVIYKVNAMMIFIVFVCLAGNHGLRFFIGIFPIPLNVVLIDVNNLFHSKTSIWFQPHDLHSVSKITFSTNVVSVMRRKSEPQLGQFLVIFSPLAFTTRLMFCIFLLLTTRTFKRNPPIWWHL